MFNKIKNLFNQAAEAVNKEVEKNDKRKELEKRIAIDIETLDKIQQLNSADKVYEELKNDIRNDMINCMTELKKL